METTENSLEREFILKWVSPFYMVTPCDDCFRDRYQEVSSELAPKIVKKLLGKFNWRTRIVGAYFTAIRQFCEFEDTIGKLLLRSDVCYAGDGYCLALAALNSEQSRDYLEQYLRYYLKKKRLFFDQGSAMAAIAFLDEENGTALLPKLMPLWESFVKKKEYWDLSSYVDGFRKSIEAISSMREEEES